MDVEKCLCKRETSVLLKWRYLLSILLVDNLLAREAIHCSILSKCSDFLHPSRSLAFKRCFWMEAFTDTSTMSFPIDWFLFLPGLSIWWSTQGSRDRLKESWKKAWHNPIRAGIMRFCVQQWLGEINFYWQKGKFGTWVNDKNNVILHREETLKCWKGQNLLPSYP